MGKRENNKLQKRMEKALENTEEAREIILLKLDRHHDEDVADEKQLHLLVTMKLQLLDVKMTLKKISEQHHLIE